MAITSADIDWFLSGGAANSDPDASLGGAQSSTAWAGGVANDLFDDISGNENADSDVEYRCVYVENGHATLTAQSSVLYISAETAGGADIAIGLDPAGVDGTATTIADEDTAPVGVTFTAPTTEGTGLSIGDLTPGQSQAIWIRRTAANTSAVASDGATLTFKCDTAA